MKTGRDNWTNTEVQGFSQDVKTDQGISDY